MDELTAQSQTVDINRDIVWFTEMSGNKIGKLILSGIEPSQPCECDLNDDGKCDMQDWLLFGEDWGRTDCPH